MPLVVKAPPRWSSQGRAARADPRHAHATYPNHQGVCDELECNRGHQPGSWSCSDLTLWEPLGCAYGRRSVPGNRSAAGGRSGRYSHRRRRRTRCSISGSPGRSSCAGRATTTARDAVNPLASDAAVPTNSIAPSRSTRTDSSTRKPYAASCASQLCSTMAMSGPVTATGCAASHRVTTSCRPTLSRRWNSCFAPACHAPACRGYCAAAPKSAFITTTTAG